MINTFDAEYNYYDVNFFNASISPVKARYFEARQSPILDNASEYKMTIIRMDVDLDIIPMFESTNRTLEITMTYPPDGLSATGALFVLPTTIFLVTTVLQAMNTLLAGLFLNIITQYEIIHGVGSWTGDPTKPQLDPFVIYDAPNNRFSFYNDVRSNSTSATQVPIFLSAELAQLFSGLDIVIATGQVLFLFAGGNTNVVNLVAPQVAGQYIFNYQTYPSTEDWYDVSRMVLTSSLIPVRQEMIGTRSQTGNNVQIGILTDFGLTFNNTDSNPSTRFRYLPTAEFRYLDILQDGPLTKVDFMLFFTNNEGDLIPVNIRPAGSFNIKVLFCKRLF